MAGETAAAAAAALAAQVAATTIQDRPSPSTSLSHSIDKLDDTMATGQSNYNAWRFRLVRILKEKSLLNIVTEVQGSTPIPEDSASPAGEKKPVDPIRDEEVRGSVRYHYVKTADNPADLLTKALPALRHRLLVGLSGLLPSGGVSSEVLLEQRRGGAMTGEAHGASAEGVS